MFIFFAFLRRELKDSVVSFDDRTDAVLQRLIKLRDFYACQRKKISVQNIVIQKHLTDLVAGSDNLPLLIDDTDWQGYRQHSCM